MTSNNSFPVGQNSFKNVNYQPNIDSKIPFTIDNKIKIPLNTQSDKPKVKQEPNQDNNPLATKASLEKKIGDNTVNKTEISKNEPVVPLASEMTDISFVPMPWSRDLILYENKKPATLKTYYFNYNNQTFAGIITDDKGKIYIYDRNAEFHRPLKHLHRIGDPYSGYHAGFREETGKKANQGNYIDLGTLEILQAALQSSAGGKYNVKITNDDSFMTNWMRATSPNENEKLRYWNGNVVKLHNKRNKHLLSYGIPLIVASATIIPMALLGISLNNDGVIPSPEVNNAGLSDAGEKALIGIGSGVGGGAGVYGATRWAERHKNIKLFKENPNLKQPNEEYIDTFVDKPVN